MKEKKKLVTNKLQGTDAVLICKILDPRWKSAMHTYICRKLILYQRLFSENWKGKSGDEGYISRRWPFKILFSVWQTPSFTFHIFAQLYLHLHLSSFPSLALASLFPLLSLVLNFFLSLLDYPPFAKLMMQ